ncbi:MAG: polyprenyl synthetase family protein [Candidatus Omnitrophota bacterium]
MNEIEYIKSLTSAIDEALVKNFDPSRGTLDAALHYALSVKGKRLRPLLFLSLLEAFHLNPSDFMDIACAIESIHTYSLIHDDLPCMDNDDFRRGMPTVHKQFNEAVALLAGDTLLTYAFERIVRTPIDPQQIVRILNILTVGIGKDGMAGGQILDLEFNGHELKDKTIIFDIHRKKTAELITATLRSAAEIIDLAPDQKEMLAEVGHTIGVAFQMADDLLDIEGDEKEVGKKLKKDQGNQSPNCVLFYGSEWVKGEIDHAYAKAIALLARLHIDFPPFLYLIRKMVYRNK